jgi:glycosyltransferase involved in cell wall biosynthesis
MGFSAIVPAHNSASTLAVCLRAIRAAGGAAIEIVVVDDCSSDDSARVAQTLSRSPRLPD